MMKKIMFVVFALSLIVAQSMFINQGYAETNIVKEISRKDALKASGNFLKMRNEWQGAKLEILTDLYDFEGNRVAYYIVAEQNGKELGNMVVADSTDRGPVIEFGNDPSYTTDIKKMLDEGKNVYYVGPFQFMGAIDTEDLQRQSNEKKNMILKRVKQKIKGNSQVIEEIEREHKFKKIPTSYKESSVEWNSLLTDESNIKPLAITAKKLDIPRISQYISGVSHPNSSCGPTAAAMITNYYDSRGYNVRGTAYYGTHASLINHLYSEFGSTIIGTTAGDFANGFDKHLEHDTPGKWTVSRPAAEGNFGTYKAHIDGNAPVAVLSGKIYSPLIDEEWHWLVGSGYDNTNGSYAWLIDPSRPTSSYDRYVKWVDHDQDWMLVFSGYNW
jgi:hypothetical protein